MFCAFDHGVGGVAVFFFLFWHVLHYHLDYPRVTPFYFARSHQQINLLPNTQRMCWPEHRLAAKNVFFWWQRSSRWMQNTWLKTALCAMYTVLIYLLWPFNSVLLHFISSHNIFRQQKQQKQHASLITKIAQTSPLPPNIVFSPHNLPIYLRNY